MAYVPLAVAVFMLHSTTALRMIVNVLYMYCACARVMYLAHCTAGRGGEGGDRGNLPTHSDILALHASPSTCISVFVGSVADYQLYTHTLYLIVSVYSIYSTIGILIQLVISNILDVLCLTCHRAFSLCCVTYMSERDK